MAELCKTESVTVFSSGEALDWRGVGVFHAQNDGNPAMDNFKVPHHHACMIVGRPVKWNLDEGNGMRPMRSDPGRICLYPAHQMTSRHLRDAEYISIWIAPDLLSFDQGEPASKAPPEITGRHNIEDPLLKGLIETFSAEAHAKNPNGRLFVESLTCALSVHLVNNYAHPPEQPVRMDDAPKNLGPKSLRRALDYIESHLTEDISLEALAGEAGLSKYYFCRLFKQGLGDTPYQYMLKRRLERAKEAMLRGRVKIADAAHFYGFSDQSHFGRLFKKAFGITPGDFQRNLSASRN